MNKKSEKKRCSNFSSFEIDLLIKLVEERREILRCPKLDAATVEKRNLAWRDITHLFNSNEAVHVYRDEEKLKKKYSNIRCERNKLGKHTTKGEEVTQIAQANDNAVEIVKKAVHFEDNNLKTESKENEDENNKPPRQDLGTENSSDEFSDSSSTSAFENFDSDEPTAEQIEYEKQVQAAADKLAQSNNNLATEKAKLEMQFMALEHQKRMEFLRTKHEHEMKRLEFHRVKHQLELDLLNVELAVKRKKLKKEASI